MKYVQFYLILTTEYLLYLKIIEWETSCDF